MSRDRRSFAQAMQMIGDMVRPGAPERIAVQEAINRFTAEPVLAARDWPPFDMSAMDGYAIGEETLGEADQGMLWIGAPQYAGAPAQQLAPGEARPIATGAAVPANASAILVRERATIVRHHLQRPEALVAGANIRRQGEDARAGDKLLEPGRCISPALIGALCAYGVVSMQVCRRPRVAILALGDELKSVGNTLDTSIVDSNGPMISALLGNAGCDVTLLGSIRDEEFAIASAFEQLLRSQFEFIVTTGGASVGDRDLLRPAVERVGGDVQFHGVHMRPGKPVLFATHPDGATFFGLPGNPVAALVGARFFVMRAIRARLGLDAERPTRTFDEIPEAGPTRILKAMTREGSTDDCVEILPAQQSHMLRPLLSANAWVIRGGEEPSTLFPLFDTLNEH
nr:molybdopterin molybdotransferase MoeA [Sphingobium xenophagum]